MPLLTKTQQIDASLAATAMQCANHLASAAVHVNRMVDAMLALSNEDLTEWLNSKHAADTLALFAAHSELGGAINTAATIAADTLSESGMEAAIPACDIRPVPEKLASQSRIFAFVDGVFSVTDAPTPEPEPEEE